MSFCIVYVGFLFIKIPATILRSRADHSETLPLPMQRYAKVLPFTPAVFTPFTYIYPLHFSVTLYPYLFFEMGQNVVLTQCGLLTNVSIVYVIIRSVVYVNLYVIMFSYANDSLHLQHAK